MVGAGRFELPTSCSQSRRASQAALRPDPKACQVRCCSLKILIFCVITRFLMRLLVFCGKVKDMSLCVLTHRMLSRTITANMRRHLSRLSAVKAQPCAPTLPYDAGDRSVRVATPGTLVVSLLLSFFLAISFTSAQAADLIFAKEFRSIPAPPAQKVAFLPPADIIKQPPTWTDASLMSAGGARHSLTSGPICLEAP